jgi:hypothetical protein
MSEAKRLADVFSFPERAYKELRRLSAELEAERADKQEQCRIIAMSAEREARLLARIAELEKGQK